MDITEFASFASQVWTIAVICGCQMKCRPYVKMTLP